MQNEVLGERYQLQEPIGRGGMATIHRARDLRMDRIVAVKVLREVYSTDPKFVTRFQREAKAASSLQHPNIVQVYDYGQSNGNYFIVMELIEGADLRRYLRSRGVLAIDRAIIIAHDVALGLGAAHRRNIVHRDVKPQNVLVGRDGSIKLTDFGIASVYKDINAERLTTTGMTLGTVQYYAPEQAQGEIVSPAADVYALGIVMYEMLTGRTPFDGDTPVAVAMQHIQDVPIPPTQYNPNIPPVLEDIIMRCLEKVPEMRFRDGSALARALEVLGEEEMGENLPPQINPNDMKTITPASPFNIIPPRPSSGGSRVNNGQVSQGKGVSSPNNGAVPYIQNGQNGAIQENIANGATIVNGNGVHGFAGVSPISEQQTYVVGNGHGNSMPGFGSGKSISGFNNQPPASYYSAADASVTRPFQYGTVPRPNIQQEQKESHVTGIITAIILFATLLLLGIAVFLAAQLHLLPFFSYGSNDQGTPGASSGATVPDVTHKSWNDAMVIAQVNGFTLALANGSTIKSGIVGKQNPTAGLTARKGSAITVSMIPDSTPTPTVTVPNLAGQTVTAAEQKLKSKGFNYTLFNVGANPDGTATTIVQGTNPAAGVPANGSIIVYVYNCGTDICATGTPTPTPTTAPTPTPTTGPKPTPTPPKPTPTTLPTPIL